jgi:hypothetical protein
VDPMRSIPGASTSNRIGSRLKKRFNPTSPFPGRLGGSGEAEEIGRTFTTS